MPHHGKKCCYQIDEKRFGWFQPWFLIEIRGRNSQLKLASLRFIIISSFTSESDFALVSAFLKMKNTCI